MSSTHSGNPQVDAARQQLCQNFANSLNEKKYTLRVRIIEQGGKPHEAIFSAHDHQGWQNVSESVTDLLLVNALQETVQMLGSAPHHDAWSVRTHSHGNGHDTEFQFHSEYVAQHSGHQLASTLMGLLFRDHHDSGKDMRRNIRTPGATHG
jgi:hypothetical protein